MQDSSWLGQKIVAKINSYAPPDPRSNGCGSEDLSSREREVLALIAQGATDKAIGLALGVAVNTVRNHVRSIYRKTGIHKRTEAAVWARQRGMVNHTSERRKN